MMRESTHIADELVPATAAVLSRRRCWSRQAGAGAGAYAYPGGGLPLCGASPAVTMTTAGPYLTFVTALQPFADVCGTGRDVVSNSQAMKKNYSYGTVFQTQQ